jgi:hypothetical protein
MGAASDAKDPHPQSEERPRCTNLAVHERAVLRRLRAACSAATGLPVDHPFFQTHYRPGEHPNDALLRMFRDWQWWTAGSDEQVIARLTRRR